MLEKELKLLFDSIVKKDSIHQMAQIIQKEIFDNPVMIFNEYFRTLALSSDIEFHDDVWDYAIENHCCSKESIESFRDDSASELLFGKGDAFLYNTNLGKNIPRILGKISSNKQTCGYLVVFEVKHKIIEEDVDKANLVCQALSIPLSVHTDTESRREYFYKEILDSTEATRIDIENEIKQFKWDFKDNFIVFNLQFKQSNKNIYDTYICSLLNEISYDMTAFINQNQIFAIGNFNSQDEIESYIKQIDTICKDNDCIYGMSNIFSHLIRLPIYFRQSLQANEIGKLIHPSKKSYYYTDYINYDLLRYFGIDELKSLRCKQYSMLKDYDKENDTDLLNTCITYFLHSSSVTITSKVLGIHRNTLNNRLIRIEEIIRCSMQDIKMLDLIYHSSIVDTWMNLIKEDA